MGLLKVIVLEKVTLSDMQRLFVNTLTADDKYSLLSRNNSMQIIQTHLSQKQKAFSQLFCAIFKPTLNFENFQKKMTIIAYVFLNIRTRKEVVI